MNSINNVCLFDGPLCPSEVSNTRGADKSLVRQEKKQCRKHVRDARDFNNIANCHQYYPFFFLQGKAPNEIHAILTETLAFFLPGRAKDLSAPPVSILQ